MRFKGTVSFTWKSDVISPEMLERALFSSIVVRKGARAKLTDREGIIWVDDLKVEGEENETNT